jgi:hypothetical protein
MRILLNYLILTLLIIFIVKTIFDVTSLKIVISVLTLLVSLLSIFYSNRINKVFGSVLFLTAIFLLAFQKADLTTWIEGITKNLPLVGLIVVVPVLAIPIKLGQYDVKIVDFILRFVYKSHHLYFFISILFFILSPILNLGAIHLIHTMIKSLDLPKPFLGRVYVRSFFSAGTWAPYFASVYLVLYYLNLEIYDYIIYGLSLGFLQIIVSYFLFLIFEKRRIEISTTYGERKIDSRKLLELFFALLILVLGILIIERYSSGDIVVMITCMVVIFTTIWCLYLNQKKDFKTEAGLFLMTIIPNRANEIVIFISAGFFGYVISETYFGKYIESIWLFVADESVFLVIVFTILGVSIFSFLGIHQIVTISIILSSVNHNVVGINDIIMALTLLSSYVVSATISPVAPANIAVASLLQQNIYRLILKWNLSYVAVIIFVHSLTIYLFFLWLG